ncbi:hypothetical protein GCM10018793_43300 [Streptomyces sulfonofaciens]|uniref:Uncharacterized protein n=1 Tax=Streptomyces sulfonofaciens TaxID=68272 RepID=A0A919GF29_9ACTN|nr:hypothetical protein GCM10018793_43300 [Streptomyces sulfonofaciens]
MEGWLQAGGTEERPRVDATEERNDLAPLGGPDSGGPGADRRVPGLRERPSAVRHGPRGAARQAGAHGAYAQEGHVSSRGGGPESLSRVIRPTPSAITVARCGVGTMVPGRHPRRRGSASALEY